jgi:hypothetical protein
MRHEPSSDPVGRIGRVTGRVAPGETGEVMLSIRGGTSAYHAFPADDESVIAVGEKVLVIDFRPPQSVLVDRLPDFLS